MNTISITFAEDGLRRCGGCTLCCKLLPTKEINKPANTRCPHQRYGKGCAIYERRPLSCKTWSCRWLVNNDTGDQSRPDRSHVVIDIMPDYVTIRPNDGGPSTNIEVVQIWCDPNYPDAHRDPAIRAYIARRGEEGIATLVRWDNRKGLTIFPPAMSSDGEWHEVTNGELRPAHMPEETLEVVASAQKVLLDWPQ
jgi:hypothetical protein